MYLGIDGKSVRNVVGTFKVASWVIDSFLRGFVVKICLIVSVCKVVGFLRVVVMRLGNVVLSVGLFVMVLKS